MSVTVLPGALRRTRDRLLAPFLSQQPADRLIRRTAREQWKLLTVNLVSSLGMAFTEGATLAVIYFAVQWLSHQSSAPGPAPQLAAIPGLGWLMAGLPAPHLFVSLMLLAVLLQLGQSLASYLSRVSIEYFAARCKTQITARLHAQILSFTFPHASRYRLGDLNEYIGQGPVAVAIQIDLVNQVLVGALLVIMYLVILLRLSPWLMLSALVLGGVIAIIQKQLIPGIRAEANRVTDIGVELGNRINEDIQGLRLLHSSGQLDQAGVHLLTPLRAMERSLQRRSRLVQVIEPVSRLMPVLAFALIATLSLVVFQNRSAGVLPNLITFMLALQRMNARLSGIGVCVNMLNDNSSRIDRLNQILSPAGKEFRRQGGNRFHGLEDEIRLEQVSLRYLPELPPALEEINLNLRKGCTLALVGRSGAGKSSIADLLVGLYSPTTGRILIDGIDLGTIDLASWQQRLGVVSQDTFLFNASLAENIAFGCPWATRADIAAAATRAQAAGFISNLSDGYDTVVGERGYRLSGGQRQRISLARAILRQPELLILDEATSALDSESERLVQQAIEEFEGNHTILVIAHRLSTVMNADEIVVLDQGRIVERGTHRSLLAEPGRYATLWLQQSNQGQSSDPQALVT